MTSSQPDFNLQHVEAGLGHELLACESWTAVGHSLSLSPRELDIVKGIFDDEREQSIANTLGISVHTVHTYMARIYQKLGVHSRVSLVLRIIAESHAIDYAISGPD